MTWAGAIFAFAVVPTHFALSRTVGEREALTTQIGHFIEFAVLAGLAAWSLTARSGPAERPRAAGDRDGTATWPGFRVAGLAWAAAVAYGALIEVVQAPLPYRSAQWSDLAIDAAGAFAGLVAFSCGWSWRERTRRGRAR